MSTDNDFFGQERRRGNHEIVERLTRLETQTLIEIRGLREHLDKIDNRLGTMEKVSFGQSNPTGRAGLLATTDVRFLLIVAVVLGAILGNAGISPLDLLGL